MNSVHNIIIHRPHLASSTFKACTAHDVAHHRIEYYDRERETECRREVSEATDAIVTLSIRITTFHSSSSLHLHVALSQIAMHTRLGRTFILNTNGRVHSLVWSLQRVESCRIIS